MQFHSVRHTLDHHPMMAKSVDFERYQVAWQKGLRSGAESNVSAQYFEESGFHSQGLVKPAGLPDGSRTLHVNGTYRQDLGERMAVRTGVSYQEMLLDTQLGNTLPALVRQRVNAFGIGSTELGSGLVVEYGLYSMLLDGTFAVAPHGGVVVDLGDDWKLDAVARKRFRSEEEPGLGTFGVAYFRDVEAEPATDDHYYRVGFASRPGRRRVDSTGGGSSADRRHPARLLHRRLLRSDRERVPGPRRRAPRAPVRAEPPPGAADPDHAGVDRRARAAAACSSPPTRRRSRTRSATW